MTTAIQVRLRDGTPAVLRPIRPEDRRKLEEGFARLSDRSRYLRFHTFVSSLSEDQLRYLTEVDHRDHVAIVALTSDDEEGQGMGVARYIRLREDPRVAEAAVTVVDEYQGRGLGTLLLGALARHALAGGVSVFRNYVLAENTAMLELFDQLGGERHLEDSVYRVDLALPSAPEDLPDTPAGRVLKAAAHHELPALDASLPPVWFHPRDARPAGPGEDAGQERPPRPRWGERGALRDWLDSFFHSQDDPGDE
jgi:GNAT superfamily N-acetyltransferase